MEDAVEYWQSVTERTGPFMEPSCGSSIATPPFFVSEVTNFHGKEKLRKPVQ